MTHGGQLLAVDPDGTVRFVPNTYEGIKEGLDQATLAFVSAGQIGFWIDDEGMLTGKPLNVPVAFMAGAAFYGPAVLCAGSPDDEGDSLPAPMEAVSVLSGLADQWVHVVEDARRKGQSPFAYPNAATIPPPTIVAMDQGAFERFLETGEWPDAGVE